jgi:phospholipid/cholesterol/gamma-HCH transport system substrate-binding protein
MPQKKQVKLAELKLGIFVIVALLMVSALILQQSWGINWFSKSRKVLTYLTDVGGLKPGAPVWFAGIEIGRVRQVTIVSPENYPANALVFRQIEEIKNQIGDLEKKPGYTPKQLKDLQDQIRNLKLDIRFVEVRLDIQPQYLNRLSRDSEVSIESRGLIGDSFIDISPGTYGVPPILKGEYYVIESTQSPGFREIMTGANDVVANFGVMSEQFKTIVKKINPEKVGSGMGEILQDTQRTIRQAEQMFSRATVLIDEMHSGKGTIGQLVNDPALYKRLVDSLEKFNSIAENIQNGKGTIGKLINDPSAFNAANETLQKAQIMMDRIEKGEGTLGKLSKDDAFYENARVALDRFATLVNEIEQGKGTLGMLLKNPSLYNNLDQSTAEVTKLLYDIRKDPKKFLTIRFRIF